MRIIYWYPVNNSFSYIFFKYFVSIFSGYFQKKHRSRLHLSWRTLGINRLIPKNKPWGDFRPKHKNASIFWKRSKICHVGVHWIALTEYSQMSTHTPGFQYFFRCSIILYWIFPHFVWVLIWEYSVRAYQWIPTWQGLDGFKKSFCPCSLDESSLGIGRIKGVLDQDNTKRSLSSRRF